ncbi:unnamed protein product [Tetraodon nigroviridis]|nr:unnamed protein product [Tetraodon nigroviridis]
MHLQPISCRSPEILLGLPFSHGIDMWGCGCVLAFLYLQNQNLFQAESTYAMMRQIVQLLGQPEDHLLSAGKYTREYFRQVEAPEGPAWRLKTPEEYAADTGAGSMEDVRDSEFESLIDLVNVYDYTSLDEFDDRFHFIDLLTSMLNVDASKRISAFQAGNHPFITMSHLSDPHDIAYLEESVEMMRCCSEVGSEDQQCSEEALEEQQVWEQHEDEDEDEDGPRNPSEWEEPEPEGWGQPTDHEWEQPSTDDWEQAEDSDWEEPHSVHRDLQLIEWVFLMESATPSLETQQADCAAMGEAVFGLKVCFPAASAETTDSSSQDSAWKSLSEGLQRSWSDFKSFFTSFF